MELSEDTFWSKLYTLTSHNGMEEIAGNELQQFFVSISQHGNIDGVMDVLQYRMRWWIENAVVPKFWDHFVALSLEKRLDTNAYVLYQDRLSEAMKYALDAFTRGVKVTSLFDNANQKQKSENLLKRFRKQFCQLIFQEHERKMVFLDVLTVIFGMSLEAYTEASIQVMDGFDIQLLLKIFAQLHWEEITEPVLANVLYKRVWYKIHCESNDYMSQTYDAIHKWADEKLVSWAETMVQSLENDTEDLWTQRIHRFTSESFGEHYIANLFNIIKFFPESLPALKDLKRCLLDTNQTQQLTNAFSSALTSRLLLPGANTEEILELYLSIMKAFEVIDPRGILLESISIPIKQYLRGREDTVRCIVSSLTGSQQEGISSELSQNMHLIQQYDDTDDDEEIDPEDWEPDPIEANPFSTNKSRDSKDLLRILVNIYGSKKVFVKEYGNMLADKLLRDADYATDREIHIVELLKLRFGEKGLQTCEIMLRDLEESKRVNANMQSDPSKRLKPIDAIIISLSYWPSLQESSFQLHPNMAKAVDAYKESYNVMNNPRSLVWMPLLGSVELTVELHGIERDVVVTPLQATIILHFEDRDMWSLDDLACELQYQEENLLETISIWTNLGVLQLSADRTSISLGHEILEDVDDRESYMEDIRTAISSVAQVDDDMENLESYILGILSNYGSLSMQKIHHTLSNFARSGAYSYEKTISGLSVVLKKLEERKKIMFVSNEYRLPK